MTPEQQACIEAMNERAKNFQKWLLGVTYHMGTHTANLMGLKGEFGCVTGDGLIDTLFQIKPEGFSLIELPESRPNNFAATCLENPKDVYSIEEFQAIFDEHVKKLQRDFINELKEWDDGACVNWNAVKEP